MFPWQTSTNIRLIKKTKSKSGTNKNSTESKFSETMQTQLKQTIQLWKLNEIKLGWKENPKWAKKTKN